jgi:hypothetical protein
VFAGSVQKDKKKMWSYPQGRLLLSLDIMKGSITFLQGVAPIIWRSKSRRRRGRVTRGRGRRRVLYWRRRLD